MPATAQHFQRKLKLWFQEATELSKKYLDVRAGDLHTATQQNFGGGEIYGRHNRIVVCCGVMYRNIDCKHGDEVLQFPEGDSGLGMTLVIRYKLPRPD